MIMILGALAGALCGLFAWVLCRAAALGDRQMAVAPVPVRREVGTCGSCGGPIMLDPVAHKASCPCGDSVLSERFLRYGETA